MKELKHSKERVYKNFTKNLTLRSMLLKPTVPKCQTGWFYAL